MFIEYRKTYNLYFKLIKAINRIDNYFKTCLVLISSVPEG